jgi:hypothetical protein
MGRQGSPTDQILPYQPQPAASSKYIDTRHFPDPGWDYCEEVRRHYESGNLAYAEYLIDQKLHEPWYGTTLAEYKAKVLQASGREREALDWYLDIVNGRFSNFTANFDELAEIFQLALSLDDDAAVDRLATLLIETQNIGFYSFDVPTSGRSPKERLAYAYLALGLDAHHDYVGYFEGTKDDWIAYCEKARELLPYEPLVLIHLAHAYFERDGMNASASSRALLADAYVFANRDLDYQNRIKRTAKSLGIYDLPLEARSQLQK